MMPIVYADHAATTQLDIEALEAMRPYLTGLYGNPSAHYAAAQITKKALQQARQTIAACIGADEQEIFFTSGGTEANNWAVKGIAFAGKKCRSVVTSTIEHHSVLASCTTLERMGYSVAHIPATREGYVTPAALKAVLSDEVGLVSVMLVNNELGTIQPIRALADTAHQHGALLHTDAVTAMGHMPVNVGELGVDLLSASAHKFGGPKGIGFLYVKKGTPIVPLLDGGAQEGHLRAGTENVAGAVGMAVALHNSVTCMTERRAHIDRLTAQLLDGLQAAGIPFVRHGGTDTLPGLLSLAFPTTEAETLLHRLDLSGIMVSAGAACNGTSDTISHVLQAIGLTDDIAASTIRISLGYSNTDEDVSAIIEALRMHIPHHKQ